MSEPRWLIYGAYGYTGTLVAEEAVRRGHRPLLAGRAVQKLAPLAARLGLDDVAVGLEDPAALASALEGIDLVFHAAGPFVHTSEPMIRACLAAGASYVDITGEIPVFQNTFAHDAEARERGVALISGVGFDVVPTDCLARHVAEQVPGAVELELAIAATAFQASAGTTRTVLEGLRGGSLARRDGRLVPLPFGEGLRRVRFPHGERWVMPIPWGDLETAYHSTGIPTITTYLECRPEQLRWLRLGAAIGGRLLALPPLRRLALAAASRIRGPSEEARRTRRSYVWARAADAAGGSAEAWLVTAEGYQFTALSGIRCVERTLAERPHGALTPAQAFGPDLVLEIDDTRRYDRARQRLPAP
jgi:short subunit dehydrogenase-like uncharacterized protein